MAKRREFRHEGFRLFFDEYGSGPRPLILLPGLLLSRKMHAALAESLAERGNRVYVLDFLGHGESDRPRDLSRYTMPLLGDQVIGLTTSSWTRLSSAARRWARTYRSTS